MSAASIVIQLCFCMHALDTYIPHINVQYLLIVEWATNTLSWCPMNIVNLSPVSWALS